MAERASALTRPALMNAFAKGMTGMAEGMLLPITSTSAGGSP
jgi:hypothetical protein